MPARVAPLDTGVIQIPYHFRCPISLELMSDPVTVATGQTYDRASIESWVATGNTTCPVTRAPLNDFTLIPNHNLRRLIQDWCVANKSRGVERIPTPKQPADPAHLRALLLQLGSSASAPEPRRAALRRLRALARESDKNRSLMSAHGLLPTLLSIFHHLAATANDDDDDELLQSLALLVMFPLSEPECTSLASDPDRVAFLVSLLNHPTSMEARDAGAPGVGGGDGGHLRGPRRTPASVPVDDEGGGEGGGEGPLLPLPGEAEPAEGGGGRGRAGPRGPAGGPGEVRRGAGAGDGGAAVPGPVRVRGVRGPRDDGAGPGEDHTEGVGQGDGVRGGGAPGAVLRLGAAAAGGGGRGGGDAAAAAGPERLHRAGEAEGAAPPQAPPGRLAPPLRRQFRRFRLQRRPPLLNPEHSSLPKFPTTKKIKKNNN
ncbi:hypothetical protein H6P81_015392 [Aristolochia fimbriata]|uniref:U-box domain-containing protein n=1 Tax=Aristolochia fimbriata TaxID=158543 RepID=A0AAV7E5H9_ARIFI|nr:hypothetical protein H6P81_015392 [Aristolochia fimbriata]